MDVHNTFNPTANTPNKMEHLKSNMLTEMDGNPPIYITKRRSPQGEEIYVNNAMILKSRSNVDLKNEHNKRQVSLTKTGGR
jgi:fasciclin 1